MPSTLPRSSTGEASAPEDYLWLMARAGYTPVIEYCGGTWVLAAAAVLSSAAGWRVDPAVFVCLFVNTFLVYASTVVTHAMFLKKVVTACLHVRFAPEAYP